MTRVQENIVDDLDYVDGLETVIVRQAGTTAKQVVLNALRRQVSAKEAEASNGVYTQHDVKWELPTRKRDTGVFTPEAGDLIVSEQVVNPNIKEEILDDFSNGSIAWTVNAVDLSTLKTRWRCWSKRLNLDDDNKETLIIEKATYKRDGTGALKPTWASFLTALDGHVQEVLSDLVVRHERREVKITHQVFVKDPDGTDDLSTIQAGMRVKRADNSYLNIVRVTHKDDIMKLTMLDTVATRSPVDT